MTQEEKLIQAEKEIMAFIDTLYRIKRLADKIINSNDYKPDTYTQHIVEDIAETAHKRLKYSVPVNK